jgi:archaeal type IV pilus assembly protein PilA
MKPTMKLSCENAVSPVVGVMLMLVVTIIIAAVVSAFASGAVGTTTKTPQATIKAAFSQSNGMTITHTGGDTLSTANLMFTMTSDSNFGQGLSAVSNQIIYKNLISDASGNTLQNTDGTTSVTSFTPGETLFISRENLKPNILQPIVADGTSYPYSDGTWSYHGDKGDLWKLCYVNPDNIGKTFTLTLSDKASGAAIAKTTVIITQ